MTETLQQLPERIAIAAGPKTDWFADPAGGAASCNAPVTFFTPPHDKYLLSAKVEVEFSSAFDAGALLVHEREDLWAKLAFEYSTQRQPMIVSVVTRGVSDDCNSAVIDLDYVYLRVYRSEEVFAFHYSHDGEYWHLVRYFTLGKTAHLRVGFLAQSPTGERCSAVFSEIRYKAAALPDIRSGD